MKDLSVLLIAALVCMVLALIAGVANKDSTGIGKVAGYLQVAAWAVMSIAGIVGSVYAG